MLSLSLQVPEAFMIEYVLFRLQFLRLFRTLIILINLIVLIILIRQGPGIIRIMSVGRRRM